MVDAHGSAESIFAQGYRYTFGILSPARNYLRGVIAVVQSQRPQRRTPSPCSAPTSRSPMR